MDKEQIREKFHKQNYKHCNDYKVFKSILKIIKSRHSTRKKLNLLMYIPKEKEINLYKYKRIFVKYCNIYSTKMFSDKSLGFCKLRLPFTISKYKIKETISNVTDIKIDIALIPCLGIDSDFRRIGFGKGYYDRTFFRLDYDLLIIFIQNNDVISNKKICSKLDIQGDFYITSRKIYKRKELI